MEKNITQPVNYDTVYRTVYRNIVFFGDLGENTNHGTVQCLEAQATCTQRRSAQASDSWDENWPRAQGDTAHVLPRLECTHSTVVHFFNL